eukprot:CAMPEP_0185164128 /NCGR_PEP_ID=MMETSP1139-20130426/8958_1 /TAXON_ID=298111 /ORGANISM="Pavlova sp., Strain CCMP459" /LENGTH=145 /DNA_ID=CAMNT_0027729495 /DNA_START=84 /DNA_END=522 /DNA_ORIENTATION=+
MTHQVRLLPPSLQGPEHPEHSLRHMREAAYVLALHRGTSAQVVGGLCAAALPDIVACECHAQRQFPWEGRSLALEGRKSLLEFFPAQRIPAYVHHGRQLHGAQCGVGAGEVVYELHHFTPPGVAADNEVPQCDVLTEPPAQGFQI